ncbi:Uncharacterised protein [Staphylococcus piscifermentans]|uniref:Uncharacterized protein n=1 Tax=Staphylococcus piscifermentans TaxID=70258 RepID=A0A239UFZ0_9STAP|nr:hypothetical protein SPI02_22360 [Staphylococcus piscifermentans]SNV08802.1 Uncharacterised protein [Staphylococcus piscifermentans]
MKKWVGGNMNIKKLVVLVIIVGVILLVNYKLDIIDPVTFLSGVSIVIIASLFRKPFKSKDK